MSSVGPELPPHLAKRKRPLDDEWPHSPPRKLQAASPPPVVGPALCPSKNPDELDVEEDSEDDYGPAVPSSKTNEPAADPPLPQSKNPDELDLDSSSGEDSYGPSVPAVLKPPIEPSPPLKRILGPAPPPADINELPLHSANSDSDSDDDYGPSLPPAPGSAAEAASLAQRRQEQEALLAQQSASSNPTSKPQRAEWMLAPPTDSDWTTRVDPTKLKNRRFASGKGAKAPAEKSGVSAIWTETPEQKRQRLEDEVMGRAEPSSNNNKTKSKHSTDRASNTAPAGADREQAETERRIREYNERNRGRSLMEERRAAQERGAMAKEEEDDPSKRGFDREKDMALGGRMGEAKRREMLGRAADFGSRFQKGKYL